MSFGALKTGFEVGRVQRGLRHLRMARPMAWVWLATCFFFFDLVWLLGWQNVFVRRVRVQPDYDLTRLSPTRTRHDL
jgi:hypothetical protein